MQRFNHENVVIKAIDGPTAGIVPVDDDWLSLSEQENEISIVVTRPLFDLIPKVRIEHSDDLSPEELHDAFDGAESVYIGLGLVTGLVKIGYSSKFDVRKKRYVTEAAEPIAFEIMPGTREIERALHEQFRAARVDGRREWFYPHPSLLSYMISMR